MEDKLKKYQEKQEYIANQEKRNLDKTIKYLDDLIKGSDVDLHTHSNYSDGDLTPIELIELARDKNLLCLSITDHDTIEGVKSIDDYLYLWVFEMLVLLGVELTIKVDKGRMHLLGYGIDINDKDLNNSMDKLKDNSINSVLSMIEYIKKEYNMKFKYQDILNLINQNKNIGRPDIAKLCVKYGYATNVQDAFNKYLIDAHSKTRTYNDGISYEEGIDLVLKSGGIPVLAHPYSLEMSNKELLNYLKELKRVGLMGIEVYHPNHSFEQTNKYLELSEKLDLLVSGGTDFHGKTVKPNIELGSGKNNNIKIRKKELSIFDSLKSNHYHWW